jgi:OOP family OmpA-OmpF porin
MTRLAVAVVIALGVVSPARAGVEVGGTAGLHIFSESNALGTQKNDPVHLANSALFGLRLGIYIGDAIGIEAEGAALPTETASGVNLVDVFTAIARGHLLVQLRAGDPTNSLLPFLTIGGGAMRIVKTSNENIIRTDTDGFAYAGLGAKYRAGGGWGVRLDARVVLPPSNIDGKRFTLDFEALASLYREFGRKEAPKPPPPKKDEDTDNDGLTGSSDTCPDQAEDKDDFKDEDGCPELDNDEDGIPDETDKCKGDPEDKDNFKDDDGCPELDNDEDGVPDAADKCADTPETKNGFDDEDGCADDLPEKLAKILVPITGVTFKANTADLQAASNKALDKVAAVLVEFKTIKLEVAAHTDDQPLKAGGKFADNDALTLARAEAVKAYLVKKGVGEEQLIAKGYGSSQPIQDPAGLKGGKLNAARAMNRRVELKLPTAEAPAVEPKAEEKKDEPKKDDKKDEKKDELP